MYTSDFLRKNQRIAAIILLITTGILTRFWGLGVIPPANNHYIVLRVLTAITSIVNTVLFFTIIAKTTRNVSYGCIAGIIYLLLPWHIEQGRVFSPSLLLLAFLLSSYYMSLRDKFYVRLFAFILGISASSIYLVLQFNNYNLWSFLKPEFLSDLYKLYSGEFLFFENDAFWMGGFRTLGIMLPGMIPAFFIGLLFLIQRVTAKFWIHLLFICMVTLFTLSNKRFPEQGDYFLLSPYVALILSIGVRYILELYKYANTLIKSVIVVYSLIVIYDYIIFTHFYTTHYMKRITNELKLDDINF